jgi:hypothetical protein
VQIGARIGVVTAGTGVKSAVRSAEHSALAGEGSDLSVGA